MAHCARSVQLPLPLKFAGLSRDCYKKKYRVQNNSNWRYDFMVLLTQKIQNTLFFKHSNGHFYVEEIR